MDIVDIVKSVVLGGGATLIATQILKQDYIPLPFEKYPRLTSIVISLIAAAIAVWQTAGDLLTVGGLTNWLTVAGATFAVAAVTYKNIKPLKGSDTTL